MRKFFLFRLYMIVINNLFLKGENMNISAINSVNRNSRVNFCRQYSRDLNSVRKDNSKIVNEVRNALKEEGIYTVEDENGLLIPVNPKQLSAQFLQKYPVKMVRSCMSPESLELIASTPDNNEHIPEALSDIYDASDNIGLDM